MLRKTEKDGMSIKENMPDEKEKKQKKDGMSIKEKQKKRLYLQNKDLYIEIIVSKAKGKLTRDAEKMLILLAKNVVRKMYYANDDDRLDCLQNAYLDLFNNWHNFNELKGTDAFSYYTEIVKRGLAGGWRDLHKKKGDENAIVISLHGFDDDGNSYDRF